MPELPEVENVKLSLENLPLAGLRFRSIELKRPDLRVRIPRRLPELLRGQTVRALGRRAKYLLFETEDYFLISHLGMTGTWRPLDELRAHDHILLHFDSGLSLVFNDPRRFGILDFAPKNALQKSRWLKHLGPEPLSEDFNAQVLYRMTRKLKASIKAFLMDQRRVVGVGNIYASEALYRAGVRPMKPAGKLTAAECGKIVDHVRGILGEAITAGGSTISDYRNVNGQSGRFQNRFSVYERAGEPCPRCETSVRERVIAGRSTFWCPQCQR